GRGKGCRAADPGPTGSRAAERAGINGDPARAATGPAVAGNERAAAAGADRHVDDTGNTDNAFGRGHAGDIDTHAWQRQARDGAISRACSKSGDTIIPVSGDNAGDAVARARCQARNAAFADACRNADDALDRDRAGDVNAAVRRTCQAQTLAIANAGRQAVAIDALGRGHAGGANTGAGSDQARNAATTNAGRKAPCTDNAFSGDHAGHAIACNQARNPPAAGARGNTPDAHTPA